MYTPLTNIPEITCALADNQAIFPRTRDDGYLAGWGDDAIPFDEPGTEQGENSMNVYGPMYVGVPFSVDMSQHDVHQRAACERVATYSPKALPHELVRADQYLLCVRSILVWWDRRGVSSVRRVEEAQDGFIAGLHVHRGRGWYETPTNGPTAYITSPSREYGIVNRSAADPWKRERETGKQRERDSLNAP